MKRYCAILILLASMAVAQGAQGGEADVVMVVAQQEAAGTWRFRVTVRHADVGWDHYADRWDVLDPGGAILGTRTLLHPHVEEQPFTRSLGGVEIPEGVTNVDVRARDSVHGYGGKVVSLELPR